MQIGQRMNFFFKDLDFMARRYVHVMRPFGIANGEELA